MEESKEQPDNYNSEPVEYCTHCLSLAIRDINNQPYCDECGCTATDKTDIHTWENMYKQMYGKNYINKK